ncbi:carboxypeptidase-like regulatory domain-containing protein [Salinimicrobium sediminilitoris]|uniref:carboxypeptidase-like regulatory domain-containing protein n=1 Tax=Salinimicrobium sediminilitoris TaxID=2876715 RepID=UPI001E605E02|nr:carboxypeptidase-like regulatory domain-containing protein [Salinimicrobium sediminilitoris]MCC8359207.1 carboxypeptidase-like regulatory domain-containing protein [Salinimicrobium sediminilitoris]
MKYLIFIFCTLFSLNLQAQERGPVRGIVKSQESLLQNVHINNVSSGKYSVSGEKGEFELNIKLGDTLVLSHVGMEDLIRFIKQDDLQELPVVFEMVESSMELKEVVVNETSEINVVSLGIIPKKIEKLSMNERRLRTAGDFKPIHLLSLLGGSLEIDPILNAINGRTKKLKRNIKIEKAQRNIAFFEINYKSYMEEAMELSQQESALLIDFMLERKELPRLLEENNDAQIKLFLHDSWFQLKDKMQGTSQ